MKRHSSSKSSSQSSQQVRLISQQDVQIALLRNPKNLFDQLLEQSSSSLEESKEIVSTLNLSPRSHGCRCTKIGCLKMYCECFSNGKSCGPRCECVCCENKIENESAILRARQMANLRNPNTFKGIPVLVLPKRCTCKKSFCRKNYCECYRANIKCSQECECLHCQNGKPHQHQYLDSLMEIEVQA